MYTVIVQTWFFLTPIVYHPAIVPAFWFALWLNPLYYLVQTFRKPIYDSVRRADRPGGGPGSGVLSAGQFQSGAPRVPVAGRNR